MSDVMAGRNHGADIGGDGGDQQALHVEDDGLGLAGWGYAPAPLYRNQRRLRVALRQREDLDAIGGHADRVLELRRQRTVARHRGPAVGQDFYVRLAEIDHRLDGEEHAGLQRHALAGPADMDDVRLVMEHAPEAVAAEIAHHAHLLRFDEALDRMADVAGGGAGFYRGDAAHHRLIGDLDQPLRLARDRPDGIHPAGIAIPAVDDEGDVDIDDVAFLQRPVAGHAVAD